MSFLSNAQREAASASLQAIVEPDEDDRGGSTSNDPSDAEHSDGGDGSEQESATQADTAAVSPGVEADTSAKAKQPPSRIPYARFKEAVTAKNQAAERVKALEAELASLRAQSLSAPASATQAKSDRDPEAQPSGSSWLDSILAKSSKGEGEGEPDARYQMLDQRLRAFEAEKVGAALDAEVTSLVTRYPGVPASALYQAVVQAPENPELEKVAEQIYLWIEHIRSQGDDVGDHKQVKAAPRSGRATSGGNPHNSVAAQKPRSLREAGEMAARALGLRS